MNSKDIKRLIRLSPLANSRLYHLFRFYVKRGRMNAMLDKRAITGEDRRKIVAQMKEAMVIYHWDFDEFFMYRYSDLTPEERHSFVPEYEKNIFCNKVNDPVDSRIFDSKWASYCHFLEYYHRTCVRVTTPLNESDPALLSFLRQNTRFMIKPDSEASGRGIGIVEAAEVSEALELIRKRLEKRPGVYILEELIVQSPEMGRFHPASVNSMRIRTFRFDDRTVILPSNIRLGRGFSVVDNTGQGGVSAALDENGVVIAACDEKGRTYDVHPDTGEQIIGIKVPRWEEAVALAKQLADVIPSVRYVGWDIALTEDGWVMIEGNDKGMFVGIQKPTMKGFRPELNKIMEEVHIRI